MNSLEYASELIKFPSVSSTSNVEVTDQIADWLRSIDVTVERIDYTDHKGIAKSNVVGKLGSGTGGLAYFGHSDVVPADDWVIEEHGPFSPTIKDGRLYGRGSTDMKGSVACFISAMKQFRNRTLSAPVYFCCTADEEVGMLGAQQVVERSKLYQEMVEGQTRAIIGEPTRFEVVHAHKGGCLIKVTASGKAAHSSTKEGINANWKMIPFLSEMWELNNEMETETAWQNPMFNPPTMTMNLGINDHTHAVNITPPQSVCTIYFRQMPGIDATPIIDRVRDTCDRFKLKMEIVFQAPPFDIDPESPFVQECLKFSPEKSPKTVSYGTDGAWFGALKQAVVFGPGSIAQAHTHDEWVKLEDLEHGTQTYSQMIDNWCS
ncbi:M20 family metallopeptidase [Thalassoglobus sp. JC818]|uniref:M20 family metallopeptidase n=1 Tax=Thalassoglobus sp. JC818 TaxID=3232136 RepID=UPI0034597C03